MNAAQIADRTADDEIASLERAYAQRTGKSRKAFKRACQHLPGGNTRNNLHFSPYPLTFANAQGSRLTDLDGNEYVDFISDFTVAIHGHNHPKLMEAIKEQTVRGMSYGGRTTAEEDLAEAVKKRFPSIELIRFTNSGTEADLYALLTACAYTQKNKFIVFDGGYLGGAVSFASATPQMNVPFEFVRVPFNDMIAVEDAISEHRQDLVGVALELMLNSGGCIPATRDFAQNIRQLTRQNDLLMIVDEVMTARLSYGGLQEHFGVTPDLITLGKIMGGGFSSGALGGRRDIMEMFDARRADFLPHGGSFNNNVFSMNLGRIALDEILTPETISTLNKRGESLRNRLNDVFRNCGIPLVFSGLGSVMALHGGHTAPTAFTPSMATKKLCTLFHRYLLTRGYWIAARGMIALSLSNSDDELDNFVDCVRTFADTYKQLIEREVVHL